MNYKNRVFLPLVLILLLSACRKDKGKKIEIEGFLLTDGVGNTFGVIGNVSDDWQIRNWSELSSTEQGFLSFPDNTSLTSTTVTTLYSPLAFPNPISTLSSVNFRSDDSVKLKVAIVDEGGQVFQTLAAKVKGSMTLMFDLSDAARFPSGKSLRYYYSFSAAGQLNFKAGYGDIKICRGVGNAFDCF